MYKQAPQHIVPHFMVEERKVKPAFSWKTFFQRSLLALFAGVFVAGFIHIAYGGPKLQVVYKVRKINGTKLTLDVAPFEKASFPASCEIDGTEWNVLPEVKEEYYCYFVEWQNGNEELLIEKSRAVAQAWAAGLPGRPGAWQGADFYQWVQNPLHPGED